VQDNSILSIIFKFLLQYIDERVLKKLLPLFLCLSLWICKSKKKKVKDGLRTKLQNLSKNECLVAIATLEQSPALLPLTCLMYFVGRDCKENDGSNLILCCT
jgi:uncharacterized membrane protein YfcA